MQSHKVSSTEIELTSHGTIDYKKNFKEILWIFLEITKMKGQNNVVAVVLFYLQL